MKYLVLLIIVVSVVILTKAHFTVYEQGAWNIITYKSANILKEKTTSRIKVIRSESILINDRVRLLVYFKVENMADYPVSFGWRNKFIETEDGISFLPTRGIGVDNLQPYMESNELHTEYRLPLYVDTEKIYWGLYDNSSHSMRYKILLQPTEKSIVVTDKPKKIIFNKLLEESKDLIGLNVKIRCKGSQYIQINQNQNIFRAICQDVDDPHSGIVNYDIAFKFPNELLPSIPKIKKQSFKFDAIGTVEWPDSTDYMSKISINVMSIEIEN